MIQLNHLDGRGGLKGWQWMYIVQGLVTNLDYSFVGSVI